MSEREILQNRIVEYLTENASKFNAPYGVLPYLHNLKRGKVRAITFGQARWLDATVFIWSLNKLTVDAQGPASRNLAREYPSVDAFLEALRSM